MIQYFAFSFYSNLFLAERIKSLNKKSTETVEEVVPTEENDNILNENDQADDEIKLYRIDADQLKSVGALMYIFNGFVP